MEIHLHKSKTIVKPQKTVKQNDLDKNKSYTLSLIVNQTPKKVFIAAANPKQWWSEEINGSTNKLGGIFTYHYQEVHKARLKVMEYVSGKKLVWTVLDNYFNFTKDQTEWKDTQIIFEISKLGNKTKLIFTHQDLGPHYECFSVCQKAWSFYIKNSLRNLILTGKGQPNSKETITKRKSTG